MDPKDENVEDLDALGDAASFGREWLRSEVSEQMRTSATFGMLADLESLAEPFYLGIDRNEDDSDFEEGPF